MKSHIMTLTELEVTSTIKFKKIIISALIFSKDANKVFHFVFSNHDKTSRNENHKKKKK